MNFEFDNFSELKQWLLDTRKIKIEEKRYYLNNWDNLNQEEISKLKQIKLNKNIQKKENNSFKMFFENILWIFSGFLSKHIIIKICLIFSVLIGSWTFYSNPSWIEVNWFVGAIWDVRTSLKEIKKIDPNIYEMVVNNIDQINIDYIEMPSDKGWFATQRDWKIVVRTYRPFDVSNNYFITLIVHEACHWVQFKDGRIKLEPQQKIENECTYLWLYVAETIHAEKTLIDHLKKTAEDPFGHWWSWWKKDWTWWDTTNWLMDLISKEKQKEYHIFWDNYSY